MLEVLPLHHDINAKSNINGRESYRGHCSFTDTISLYFKFTGAEESIYIFTTVGMEPWGRIGSGVAELIASILILVPRTAWLGALMSLGVISGAIFFHLTILGIEVQGDGGYLFILALVVLICSAIALWIHRRDIPYLNLK